MANEKLNFDRLGYDEKEFFPRDTVNYRINGTQMSSTYDWKGNLPEGVTEYGDGLTIDYYLPANGTSTDAVLTLSPGPAKKVFCLSNNRLVPVTTHIPAGAIVRLSYVSSLDDGNGGWLAAGDWSPNQQSSLETTTISVVQSINTDSGSLPSLNLTNPTNMAVVTNWNPGTTFSMSISEGKLEFTDGIAPTLGYILIDGQVQLIKANSWSAGTLPDFTYNTTPVLQNVTVSNVTVNN